MVLAAGFLVLFIGGGARFAIGLTLKPMVDELGWGRSELGIAIALFQVVSAVCMYIAGRMSDRVSPRLVLTGGLLVSALGIGLMGVISEPWHALILYGLIFAIGNGAASITSVGVMVTRAFPGRTGLANAVVASGMSVGQLVVIAALSAVLVEVGWRAVFLWLGIAHLVLVPVVLAAVSVKADSVGAALQQMPATGMTVREAAHTPAFWLLLAIYAVCGLDDFFVSNHVVAFAQDGGLGAFFAGNLLALMGLMAFLGVIAAGAWSDRVGPVGGTAVTFAVRAAVFVLVLVDQSPLSVVIFALVFGATFLVTAPLTVLFVRDAFGTRHLGALTGLITMVHHIAGGVGAYVGAAAFDATSRYDPAFFLMLAATMVALALTFAMRR
jgi:predicted MFS family arabinose efflux permease